MYLRDFSALLKTLPKLQFMLGLHFTPACVLLLVCSLHFTHSLHFIPGPQSAVRSLRFTLTGFVCIGHSNVCGLLRR